MAWQQVFAIASIIGFVVSFGYLYYDTKILWFAFLEVLAIGFCFGYAIVEIRAYFSMRNRRIQLNESL